MATGLWAQVGCDAPDSLYTGICETYYKTGAVKTRTTFEKGVRQGLFQTYLENGTLLAEAQYEQDHLRGEMYRNFENGKPKIRIETDESGTGIAFVYSRFGDEDKPATIKFKEGKSKSDGETLEYYFLEKYGLSDREPEVGDTNYVDFPDFEAEFRGGKERMATFIQQHIHYSPKESKYLSGKCFLEMTVEADGSLSNVHVIRSCGSKVLDDEAVRVLQEMPDWIPSYQGGVAVKTRVRIPINYTR